MAGSIFIPLVSVFDSKGIAQAKSGLGSIASSVKNLKGIAVTAAASMATLGAVNFVKDSVNSARDLQSSYVGLEGLFGNLAPQMKQFTVNAESIGLSQLDASRAVTFLGSSLNAAGLPIDDVASKTQDLIGLSADLAATFGLPLQEALTGIGATFRGEYDPIERFGVAIKQAQVNALLATRGQKGLTGQALASAQAQARYDLILQATTKSQGNYAKQSDSLYVKQNNLAASFENMKASLGQSLLGPLAALMGAFKPIVEIGGKALTPMFEMLGQVITMLAPVFPPLMEAFFALFAAIQPIWDLLIKLIKPLMIPLVDTFKLLSTVLLAITPIIQIVAQILGVILTPIILGVSIAVDLLVKGLIILFDALAAIPGVGDAFKGISASLKSFQAENDKATDALLKTTDANKGLTDSLSKKLPKPKVTPIVTEINKIAAAADAAAKKQKNLVDAAVGIQKQFMDETNITDMLNKTSDKTVQSVVYLNGKFKTVVSGVSNTANTIGDSFKKSLNKIKIFYKNLNKLQAKNLSPELIAQIAGAGVDAGNATAEAILASGKKGIKGLNSTFYDIKRFAGDIGAKVAVDMQDAGTEIGNGLIDGLRAQQVRLENLAAAMALGFTKKFKKKILQKVKLSADGYAPGALGPGIDEQGNSEVNAGTFNKTKHLTASQIVNPYNKTTDQMRYYLMQRAIQNATNFNISIDVPVGADKVAIGQALVAAIQKYEDAKGKGWRN